MFEENFIPYEIYDVSWFNNKKVLVVLPHPDDETIGCGGLLLKIKDIADIDLMCVTDGSKSSEEVTAEKRYEELEAAAATYNTKNIIKLNFKDRECKEYITTIKDYFKDHFNKYDAVFVPSIYDIHPDHKSCSIAAIKLYMSKKKPKCRLLFYEVSITQPITNILIDITEVYQQKVNTLGYYKSQLSLLPYETQIFHINSMRSFTVSSMAKFAECYYSVDNQEDIYKYINFSFTLKEYFGTEEQQKAENTNIISKIKKLIS